MLRTTRVLSLIRIPSHRPGLALEPPGIGTGFHVMIPRQSFTI